ncbi:GAP family protein [Herbiconiux ginsengi]|uniref:Sap, sulfolipid-1-addressing protein n=1 Tax=Herbiconiux ginsengi TaxID=381665 RepID=A0A1H3PJX1_9MICO|nr:GAP family protein [Herbiconiux ginsengi]SDZ01386.1 Sap, sulfolipid-1-addressing protein [Herbiconiux ginsengi]
MFWHALGEVLPLAFAVIISPMPLVAVITLLLGPRGRRNAVAFTVAFVVAFFALTLALSSGSKGTTQNDSFFATVFHLVIGFAFAALFFYLAFRSWQKRPKKDAAPVEPKWLAAMDSFGVVKSAGLGALLGVANIKNVPIAIAAGSVIGSVDLAWSLVFLCTAVFAVVAGLGLILLTIVGGSTSPRIAGGLASAKAGLIRHNNVILAVLFVLLGALQLGRAFEAF